MKFLGEELFKTVAEQITNAAIEKMELAEERRNREFTYQLKEFEFYKTHYEKDIKGIFDEWFDFLNSSLIVSNKNISAEMKKAYQRKIDAFTKPEKIIPLKIKTMKYCGTETGKALALFSQISFDLNKDTTIPSFVSVFAICELLATMKEEVLGQKLTPETMLKVLLIDYEENADVINEAIAYATERKKELFGIEDI